MVRTRAVERHQTKDALRTVQANTLEYAFVAFGPHGRPRGCLGNVRADPALGLRIGGEHFAVAIGDDHAGALGQLCLGQALG